MTIKFIGQEIPGHHQSILQQSPPLVFQKHSYFGIQGESLIVSHRGSRELSCKIWLNDPTWKLDDGKRRCERYIEELNQKIGKFGIVEEKLNLVVRKFSDCVFMGFTEEVIGESSGPIPDEAGMLHDGIYTWWIPGHLKWLQLSPDKVTVTY